MAEIVNYCRVESPVGTLLLAVAQHGLRVLHLIEAGFPSRNPVKTGLNQRPRFGLTPSSLKHIFKAICASLPSPWILGGQRSRQNVGRLFAAFRTEKPARMANWPAMSEARKPSAL